jgi:signal transduction histidine kinase
MTTAAQTGRTWMRWVESLPASRTYRGAVFATGSLLVLTALLLVIYLSLAISATTGAFIGALVSPNLTVLASGPSTDEPWPAFEAGLAGGEVVTEINGQALDLQDLGAARATYAAAVAGLSVGDPVQIKVLELDGSIRNLQFNARQMPTGDALILYWLPLAASMVCLVVGVLLFALRTHLSVAVAGAALCGLLAILIAGVSDGSTTGVLEPVWCVAVALIGGVSCAFGMQFPRKLPILYRITALPAAAIVLSGALGLAAAWISGTRTDLVLQPQGVTLAVMSGIVGIFIMAGLLVRQRSLAPNRVLRDQASIVLIGFVLSMTPAVLWLIGQFAQSLFPSAGFLLTLDASMPFLLTLVFSIAVAIFAPRRIDSDVLVSRSFTYLMLMGALIVAYFLLTLGAGLFVADILPNNPILIALALFLIAILFIPVRTRLQDRVDNLYFRKRRDLQQISGEFSELLGSLSDVDSAIEAFRGALEQGLNPAHAMVFFQKPGDGDFFTTESDVRFAADGGLVRRLAVVDGPIPLHKGHPFPRELLAERGRLEALQPAVAIGLGSGSQISAFVLVGSPRGTRRGYTFEEMRFLTALSNQLSVTVERSLVIDSLERRVRELNVFGQVGQAANFTTTLDDLLELISAQTIRLVEADFQYLVLYDTSQQQLRYAFFLEEDERYADRENVAWLMGGDLYSEIIQSGQSRIIEDYTRHRHDGGVGSIYESERIRSFMLVPLIAQVQRLGAYAIGRRDGQPYNAVDLETFQRLAALAATSLEKAQLFEEVNARARQLAALNAVSQQLVAAESGELEQVYELIANSAISILQANASAILLAAPDDPLSYEFHIVVGDPTNQLRGQRIHGGRGLLGEILRTGKPQISNQPGTDLGWHSRLIQSGIRAPSILIAPLTVKDRLIAVIEVVKSDDRDLFTTQDASLLTTFASQAAVAVENARLFAMTGSALNQRLEELETLSRIDRDLARSLDQREVAKVTLKWAVQATGASSAVLGQVNLANQTMRVLALTDYEVEDYPEGADGSVWPLGKGIVRRVLRTGVPDLADLRVDPDYVASKREALSQITVPMVSGQEIIALMVLENEDFLFSLLDLEFVERLAERASIALANAQLYEGIVRAAENKSEFVAFAAHELKNPLTSIKGYSDTLLNERMAAVINDEQRQQFVGVIRSNAERMQSIIDDLRDIAASDAGKLQIAIEPLQFQTVIQDTMAAFEQQLEQKQQTISLMMPETLPSIHGDHKKLVQVLTNLVSNAYKYSPTGAELTVKVEVLPQYVLPNGYSLGESLYVGVQDTGIGMSPQDLKRIFREDYFRSDDSRARAQKGTGLGMMITQRIIEGHGGRIWVESELDHGSLFQFVIPLKREMIDNRPGSQTGIRKRITLSSPGPMDPSGNTN